MTDEFNTDQAGTDIDPEYDPETDTYRVRHDFERDGRLSLTVVVALELVALRDPDREPEPLFEAVEPDGLDSLFSPGAPFPLRNEGHLTFPVGDYEVTVHADGLIVIDPGDSDPTDPFESP